MVVITLSNEGFHNCGLKALKEFDVVITLSNEGFHNLNEL